MDERRGGLASLKRWLVGAVVAVAGLFGAAVSQAQPADESSGSDPLPVRADRGGDLLRATVLAPPAQPPRASKATRGAVSGGF
jgi:hypothetical protein